MTRHLDSARRQPTERSWGARRTAVLGTVGVLVLGLAVGGLQAASAAPQKVLQSVHVDVGRDGAVTAITSTTVRRDGDDAEDEEKTHDPVKSGDELPVRVLTAYRMGDRSGTDLDDLEGEDGRVRIDVTVQNTTVRPTVLSYDSEGRNRRSPALVGAPLTVVASTDLGETDLSSIVASDPAADEPATNGVVSRDEDGNARVQWATMLAPPRLGASATFTLVQDVSDFDPPSFDISVQPGLVTDTSVSRLVDSALGEGDGVQELTTRTISLLGSVGTVLTDVSKVLSRVESTLDGSASQLGSKTIADLQSSSAAATSALSGLAGDLGQLQSSMNSSLNASSNRAVEQLSSSFAQVKDKVLGDPDRIDRKPLPTLTDPQGCTVTKPSRRTSGTVYGQLRFVQAQLGQLAKATDACAAVVVKSLQETVGTVGDTCGTNTAIGALSCAGSALTVSARDLEAAQVSFDETFNRGLIDELQVARDEVVDALGDIDAFAQSIDAGRLAERVTTLVGLLESAATTLADDGPLATEIDELGTVADAQLDLMQGDGAFGSDDGALEQADDMVRSLCALAETASPEQLAEIDEASVLLAGRTCAGAEATAPGYTSSLVAKLQQTTTAWEGVAASVADLQGAREDTLESVEDALGWARTLDGPSVARLDELLAEVDKLIKERPQPANDDGTVPPPLPSLVDVFDEAFQEFRDNVGQAGQQGGGVFQRAADALDAQAELVQESSEDVALAGESASDQAEKLLNPFADQLTGIGETLVSDGRRTIVTQREALDDEATAFRQELSVTAGRSLRRIAAQVGAANRDLSASERQLVANLRAVLTNIGQPRQDGSGLLGALYTGARRTGASNLKIAGVGDTADAFSQVRATSLDDLYLQQAQVNASLEAEAAFPLFDLEVAEGSVHRIVFSFRVGQD